MFAIGLESLVFRLQGSRLHRVMLVPTAAGEPAELLDAAAWSRLSPSDLSSLRGGGQPPEGPRNLLSWPAPLLLLHLLPPPVPLGALGEAASSHPSLGLYSPGGLTLQWAQGSHPLSSGGEETLEMRGCWRVLHPDETGCPESSHSCLPQSREEGGRGAPCLLATYNSRCSNPPSWPRFQIKWGSDSRVAGTDVAGPLTDGESCLNKANLPFLSRISKAFKNE